MFKRIRNIKGCNPALAILFVLSSFFYSWSNSKIANGQEENNLISESLAFLLDGVDSLPQVGAPGPIVSIGENAFPVILGQYEEDVFAPVVSGAFVKKGRVIAFGHTDYCNVRTITKTDSSARLFNNVIFWAAGKDKKGLQEANSIRIAV